MPSSEAKLISRKIGTCIPTKASIPSFGKINLEQHANFVSFCIMQYHILVQLFCPYMQGGSS